MILNVDGVFSKHDLKQCVQLNEKIIFLKTIIDGY